MIPRLHRYGLPQYVASPRALFPTRLRYHTLHLRLLAELPRLVTTGFYTPRLPLAIYYPAQLRRTAEPGDCVNPEPCPGLTTPPPGTLPGRSGLRSTRWSYRAVAVLTRCPVAPPWTPFTITFGTFPTHSHRLADEHACACCWLIFVITACWCRWIAFPVAGGGRYLPG